MWRLAPARRDAASGERALEGGEVPLRAPGVNGVVIADRPKRNERRGMDVRREPPRRTCRFLSDVIGDHPLVLPTRSGHVPGALHLPRGQIELRVDSVLPDPTVRVLITCELGKISTIAVATLHEMGFASAIALDGGIKAWPAIPWRRAGRARERAAGRERPAALHRAARRPARRAHGAGRRRGSRRSGRGTCR